MRDANIIARARFYARVNKVEEQISRRGIRALLCRVNRCPGWIINVPYVVFANIAIAERPAREWNRSSTEFNDMDGQRVSRFLLGKCVEIRMTVYQRESERMWTGDLLRILP